MLTPSAELVLEWTAPDRTVATTVLVELTIDKPSHYPSVAQRARTQRGRPTARSARDHAG